MFKCSSDEIEDHFNSLGSLLHSRSSYKCYRFTKNFLSLSSWPLCSLWYHWPQYFNHSSFVGSYLCHRAVMERSSGFRRCWECNRNSSRWMRCPGSYSSDPPISPDVVRPRTLVVVDVVLGELLSFVSVTFSDFRLPLYTDTHTPLYCKTHNFGCH